MPSVATYETVESIYIAYYQRPGDPSGVRFWADYLDANNGNLDAIIDAFATSQESLDLYGPPPPQNVGSTAAIEAFINSIYQALFGRDADAGRPGVLHRRIHRRHVHPGIDSPRHSQWRPGRGSGRRQQQDRGREHLHRNR